MTKICTVPDCNNPIAPTSKYMCRECLDAYNERQRVVAQNKRDARRAKGICGSCGLNPLKEDNTQCEECSEKDKNRKEDRKEAGICVRCGEPAKEGITFCEKCAKEHSKRQRVRNLTDPVAKARNRENGRRRDQAKRDGTYNPTGKNKFTPDIQCDHIIPLVYFREAYRKEGWRNDLPEDDAVELGNDPINTRMIPREENGSGGKHSKMTKEGWALLDYFGLPKLEWETYDESDEN